MDAKNEHSLRKTWVDLEALSAENVARTHGSDGNSFRRLDTQQHEKSIATLNMYNAVGTMDDRSSDDATP